MTLFNTQYDTTQPFTDKGVQFGLTASTAFSYTVPGTNMTTYAANFKFPTSANVWVGFNKTATLPSAGVAGNANQICLNPISKFVRGGDVLSFISSAGVTDCGIELFTRQA